MTRYVRHLHKTALALLCFAALLPLAAACSRSEPRITYGFIALTYYQEREKPRERFSFFVIPEDDDGIENLDELYLYHDREQLRWLIKNDDWVSLTQDGKTWIGSRSIAALNDETLPRGQYRAVLVNKGGERSERTFSFDAPEESRFPFPTLEIAEGRYTATSAYPENRLVCYDEQGNYISTVNLSVLSGSVIDLEVPSNARSAALWAEDSLYFTSAYTDAAALH